jgi:CHAT domain-containing protein/cytochrome c-type biogenesis protein CcmH/NrfG
MGESLPDEETVREYLLGRVSDETTLEGLEDLLFTDEEFCSRVALAEDNLINDYVLGRLNKADAESFQATLAGNPDRRFKLELTQGLRERALARELKPAEDKPSFFASLAAFFHQPKYVGALAVLLIAVVALVVYLSRQRNPDELAELRSLYQQSRPTETRISQFGYAPLSQLRGARAPEEEKRLRRIEISLIEATEKASNAKTHHALGVFYLTQQKYSEAIKEFENALKFAGQNAQIHNDLGAAYFELWKTEPKKKLEDLAQSLEEFTKATELDSNLLEALFNKSLALEEMGLRREAKESWLLYLQKDSSSPWADEARKHLKELESQQTLFKPDEQVLEDFLAAYHNHDDARAQKIHNETKGLLKSVTVPLQLSRRYLLAKQRGDDADAKESIEAMTYIGNLEQAQNGDSFFFELAGFYAQVSADKIAGLLQAKDILAGGLRFAGDDLENTRSEFEKSSDLFAQLGDACEAAIAENWAVQLLPDVAKLSEGRQRVEAIIETAKGRNFKLLAPAAYYWLGMSDYHQKRFSDSARNLKTALRLAESGENIFEIQHAQDALALNYSELGELQTALSYASKMLPDRALYYQSQNQSLRNLGTLADLTLKLKFFTTSMSVSQERLSAVREISPASSPVNESLRHLVNAASAKKDFAGALRYAGESMQLAIKLSDSPENIRTKAEIHLLLADVKSKSKNCPEALTDYDEALELYSRLPEITDSLYRIHKGKLFCFQQLDRQQDFANELKIVLKLSETYRTTIREDNSRQAFFATEQDVFDVATADAIRHFDSRLAFEFVETSKARSLLDFVESEKSIAEVEKNFAAVAHPISLPEIQQRLPEQVQLVQYAVLPDRLAIWVISRTRFDFVEKQISAAELERKVNAHQSLIVGKGPASEIRQSAKELYELLIPSDLAADKQLCFVPDKSLHQLAFATLVSPSGKYLLQDYASFYAPSASVLVLATENARRTENRSESLLSVGNPDFDREENPNLPDLQAAEAEARTITADYPKSLALLGTEATREKFLRNFFNAEVVHFAGHFVANEQSPGNSKLLFAGGDLRAFELSAYKLPLAKLVVLSACETGFERYNKSEGAIGIARTLLALGAPVVVASQWKVDSEPTKDLMVAFHRNRKQKRMTSAESLRQAQLEVLNQDKTSAPFYWAAFSLFGGYANY